LCAGAFAELCAGAFFLCAGPGKALSRETKSVRLGRTMVPDKIGCVRKRGKEKVLPLKIHPNLISVTSLSLSLSETTCRALHSSSCSRAVSPSNALLLLLINPLSPISNFCFHSSGERATPILPSLRINEREGNSNLALSPDQ
jgi:hypothetical protein